MPSAGESEGAGRRWRGGRKGGTTLGTPFPSDPSLITVLTVSLRLNNNRGSSPVASLCVLIMFTGSIITQTGRRARSQPLALQLVGRDLSLLFKHSNGYIRMNHGPHNTSTYA